LATPAEKHPIYRKHDPVNGWNLTKLSDLKEKTGYGTGEEKKKLNLVGITPYLENKRKTKKAQTSE